MMPAQNVQDLFIHELSDIYSGERMIVQMLPQMANEVADGQVRTAFQEHERQTQHQIQNLEQCFQMLGVQPPSVTCYGIQGLQQEHDSFVQQNPSSNVLTMFDLGAEAKTEHYEIASYRGLIDKAQMMGRSDCARLLEENLRQEEAMAQRVEQLGHQLGQQAIQQMGGQAA